MKKFPFCTVCDNRLDADERLEKLRKALEKIESWVDDQKLEASVYEIDEDDVGYLYQLIHSAKEPA